MRWDALFSELQAQEHDRDALARDAEARELAQGEWSERSWLSALAALDIEIRLVGEATFRGQVTAQGSTWLALDCGHEDVIVAVAQVMDAVALRPQDQLWPDGDAEAPLTARLGWGHVLRALASAGEPLSILRVDGSVLHGTVDVVGRDFVRVRAAETRRMVPFASLVALRVAH